MWCAWFRQKGNATQDETCPRSFSYAVNGLASEGRSADGIAVTVTHSRSPHKIKIISTCILFRLPKMYGTGLIKLLIYSNAMYSTYYLFIRMLTMQLMRLENFNEFPNRHCLPITRATGKTDAILTYSCTVCVFLRCIVQPKYLLTLLRTQWYTNSLEHNLE